MGEQDVLTLGEARRRAFTKQLLDDVRALELLLATDRFETGVRRIGAEQEMFLVDERLRPAKKATEVLARADDPRLTTELALFNLEGNLTPQVFGGDCLGQMERELDDLVRKTRQSAEACGADVLLAGILPTLGKADIGLDSMTPNPRYFELNRVMSRLRGGKFHVYIKGLDQFETTHDSVMFEACNTSFQIHFQVSPAEFARLYNQAQAVSAPVLAAAVNSPLLMGHRLWAETRIALFERSVDARSSGHQDRGARPRVHFGDAWVRDSVLELYRDDITRHRAVLALDQPEDAVAVVQQGGVPELYALRLHNGTVYRWNRPCYGVADGVAHLRIEHRVLPAGPSVQDEVANAALFFGLMAALSQQPVPIHEQLDFDAAKENFFSAARQGLRAQFTWTGGKVVSASTLLLEQLLPMARDGLTDAGIDGADVDRYLGLVEERVRSEQTGAQWVLSSLQAMGERGSADLRHRQVATAMRDNQRAGQPVHRWPLAQLADLPAEALASYQTARQIMTTDLCTVQPEDIVDLAASMMDWSHIRHVPVEDDEGKLVGLVSHRALLRLVANGVGRNGEDMPTVAEIMNPAPRTVGPDTPTLELIHLMREHKLACLPVVEDGTLVGLVTEPDLIEVSGRLLEEYLREGR
ncbi:MAG: CBS domain-containing protein [Myxococcales bacterium]|nr:CBS domain-containing protein [Myxococcales bacterium]MCB9536647.1 CBS domain-containing protein [Myxococcales bacterium]